MKPDVKATIFVDIRPQGIFQHGAKKFANVPESDFYINVPLFRKVNLIDEYVNIYVDPSQLTVERQLINPYFIELGFFQTVNSESNIINQANKFGIIVNK